jgi:uncharacterized protein YjbJ (UPF0337 family)
MSLFNMKANWNIAKGKLQQKFAQLFDDDLQFIEGKRNELVGRIQKRSARARQKTRRTLEECCGRHG